MFYVGRWTCRGRNSPSRQVTWACTCNYDTVHAVYRQGRRGWEWPQRKQHCVVSCHMCWLTDNNLGVRRLRSSLALFLSLLFGQPFSQQQQQQQQQHATEEPRQSATTQPTWVQHVMFTHASCAVRKSESRRDGACMAGRHPEALNFQIERAGTMGSREVGVCLAK